EGGPHPRARASMGPRPSGRGNTAGNLLIAIVAVLQWGRDHLVAETSSQPSALSVDRRASMGPRPSGRGNHVHVSGQPEIVIVLQWGRDHLVAETLPSQGRARGEWLLQWGRDHLVAETGPDRWALRRAGAPASMGPRPSGRGNRAARWRWRWPHSASMGPRPSGRGNGSNSPGHA